MKQTVCAGSYLLMTIGSTAFPGITNQCTFQVGPLSWYDGQFTQLSADSIAITAPWVTSLTQHPPRPGLWCHHLLWQQGRGPRVCSSNPLPFQLQPLEMVHRWKISWMIRIVGILRHRRRKGRINVGAWPSRGRVRAGLQERGALYLKFHFHVRPPSVLNKLSGSQIYGAIWCLNKKSCPLHLDVYLS